MRSRKSLSQSSSSSSSSPSSSSVTMNQIFSNSRVISIRVFPGKGHTAVVVVRCRLQRSAGKDVCFPNGKTQHTKRKQSATLQRCRQQSHTFNEKSKMVPDDLHLPRNQTSKWSQSSLPEETESSFRQVHNNGTRYSSTVTCRIPGNFLKPKLHGCDFPFSLHHDRTCPSISPFDYAKAEHTCSPIKSSSFLPGAKSKLCCLYQIILCMLRTIYFCENRQNGAALLTKRRDLTEGETNESTVCVEDKDDDVHEGKSLAPEDRSLVQERRSPSPENVTDFADSDSSDSTDIDDASDYSVDSSNRSRGHSQYDVFISHSNHDVKLAVELLNTLKSHHFSCILKERDFLPGSIFSEEIVTAVASSRRVLLLLSRHYLQAPWCEFELQMSVCEMYDSQRALIVPILVDDRAEVPPCLRNLSVVDMRRDPNYVNKLLSLLGGPEVLVKELMPAGNVSHGLAWCYYLNYLKLILPNIGQRIDTWKRKELTKGGQVDVRMPRRMYILIPASCFCPERLSDADPRIRFRSCLDPVRRSCAGSVDRIYNQTVWDIEQSDGTVLQFVGEYSNVIHTLYMMENQRSAGLDTQQRKWQRDYFYSMLRDILRNDEYRGHASVVFFQDTDEEGNGKPLSDTMTRTLQKDRLQSPPPPLDTQAFQ